MATIIRNGADGIIYLLNTKFSDRVQLSSPLPDYLVNLPDLDFSTIRPEDVNFSYRGGVVEARKLAETDIIKFYLDFITAQTQNANYTLAVYERKNAAVSGLDRVNEMYSGNNITILNAGTSSLNVSFIGPESSVVLLDPGVTLVMADIDLTLGHYQYSITSTTGDPVQIISLIPAQLVQSPTSMASPGVIEVVKPERFAPKRINEPRPLPTAQNPTAPPRNLKFEPPQTNLKCESEEILTPLNSSEEVKILTQRVKDLQHPEGNAIPFVDYGDLTNMIDIAILELKTAKEDKSVADQFDYITISRFCNQTKKMVQVPVSKLFGH